MALKRRWSDQEILDALKYWAERYGRTPKWSEWSYKDEEGLRPTNMTVWSRCGSWNDALVMAGLEPPENRWQEKKFSRPEARRLRKQGLSDSEIGRRLGVHGSTIGKALGPRRESDVPTAGAPGTVSRRKKLRNRTREERLADLRAAIERQET